LPILWILNSEKLAELALNSINISLGKWTLTLSSKDDLHNILNKLPKYFHRLYRCYKVSPSCKESDRKSGIYHSPPYWLYGEKHFQVARCDCWQAKRRLKMQLNLWLKDTQRTCNVPWIFIIHKPSSEVH
jgi:hypothetical protein